MDASFSKYLPNLRHIKSIDSIGLGTASEQFNTDAGLPALVQAFIS